MVDTPEYVVADNRFGLGRFGLGRHGLNTAHIGQVSPFLTGQFTRYDPAPVTLANVPSRGDVVATLIDYRAMIEAGRVSGERRRMPPAPSANQPAADADRTAQRMRRRDMRDHYLSSLGARFTMATESDTPFVERLVHFWSNHFAVSIDKIAATGFAGPMEFEAIRPHVLGNFGQMMWAVETHPAMLLYLDQAQSIGPDSLFAQRLAGRRRENGRAIGLNENLGREILELHTLGADGGYSQADVTELARALTGITIPSLGPPRLRNLLGDSAAGEVRFVEQLHQPGDRMIMGRRYPAGQGDIQPRTILSDLALHPATARHLSIKLARHFVADTPPASLVERLTRAFIAGNGDLRLWYAALVDAPESWDPTNSKVKTPWEWGVSAARALNWTRVPEPRMLAGLFTELGQTIWKPGSPAGFDDIAASWMAPDALLRRIEAAERLVLLAGPGNDPRALAEHLFGPTLSSNTRAAIGRAESVQQALALLIVSPEFLRR